MYKTTAEAVEFAGEFRKLYEAYCGEQGAGCGLCMDGPETAAAICAPFTQLAALKKAFEGSGVAVGAQNVHYEHQGAFTGEISTAMLTEIGVDCCIIGHSERRQYFAETDETVNKKLKKLLGAGIKPIMCVGESLETREAGKTFEFIAGQLQAGLDGLIPEQVAGMVIAYEPIWAIGTGRTATPQQAEEVCGFIRGTVGGLFDEDAADNVLILYGGSVKPGNAKDILSQPDIDGALVGGASLVPADLMGIIDHE